MVRFSPHQGKVSLMHKYEVTICTPMGDYTVVIPASSQHGALAQAEAIARMQRGRVSGSSARQVG